MSVALHLLTLALVLAGPAAEAEEEAIEAVEDCGGTVLRDRTAPGRPVVAVNFHNAGVPDECLRRLTDIPTLERLDLSDAKLHRTGFKHLAALKGLRSLNLSCCWVAARDSVSHVDDALLQLLVACRDLEELDAAGASLTNDGLKALAKLTRLKRLGLAGTPVTGAGLKHLAGLTQLEELNLTKTRVTGAGLRHLKGAKRLRALDLYDTAVTDEGPRHLAGLKDLRRLELGRTKVTDAGLGDLRGMTRLEYLGLADTAVTEKGLKALKKALPKCSTGSP